MSLTESDMEAIRRIFKQEIRPLEVRVGALEGDRKRHSGGIKALAGDVRKSTHEVEEKVEGDLMAAMRHFGGVVENIETKVDAVHKKVDTRLEPTAVAAATAATAAEGVSKANAVDLATIDKKQDTQLKWYRHPGLPAVFLAIIEAIKWAVGH